MSVPKKRKSASAVKKKRSHQRKKISPRLIKCQKCSKPTRPHHVCPFCGTYQGREIIKLKTKKKKEK